MPATADETTEPMNHPRPVDVHLCLPGPLPAAIARRAARRDAARAGVVLVTDVAALDRCDAPRPVVVDPALWTLAALAKLDPPTGVALRITLWRPSAVELVAVLARAPDPTVDAAAAVAAAAERHAALAALAAARFGAVEHRALTDGQIVDAAAAALGLAPVRGISMTDWPPFDGDGRATLDALAAVITRGWRAGCDAARDAPT